MRHVYNHAAIAAIARPDVATHVDGDVPRISQISRTTPFVSMHGQGPSTTAIAVYRGIRIRDRACIHDQGRRPEPVLRSSSTSRPDSITHGLLDLTVRVEAQEI